MQCKELIKKVISHPRFSKFKYDTSKLVTSLTNHNRKDFSLLFEAGIYFAKLFSTFVSTKFRMVHSNLIIQLYTISFKFTLSYTDSNWLSRPSWPWSYGSWIYNYLCNQCLSPLMLCVRISIRARCTTLCDKVCQWLFSGFLHQ